MLTTLNRNNGRLNSVEPEKKIGVNGGEPQNSGINGGEPEKSGVNGVELEK